MAYTEQRYCINNLVNADNITMSSQAVGSVRQAKKTGTGTASCILLTEQREPRKRQLSPPFPSEHSVGKSP